MTAGDRIAGGATDGTTTTRPRICLITAAYPTVDAERHGGTTYARTMAHALQRAGADVEVVCFSDGLPVDNEIHFDGSIVVHRVRVGWRRLISLVTPNLAEGWALMRHVERIAGDRGFDAIEGPNLGGICWAVMLRQRDRFWLRMHTSRGHDTTFDAAGTDTWRGRFRQWLDGFTARHSRHLITHSDFHVGVIRREYRLGVRPIDVVAHGIDAPQPGEPVRREARVIAAIGMLTPRKAPDTVLDAFELLWSRRPDARLMMIGEDAGRYQEAWRPTDPAIRAQVDFAGLVSDAELERRWQMIDVLVIASRYESFGLVAAEAMCRGVPLIVTDAGALPEVVGDAAVIVPVDSPDRLAAAIDRLLDDPAERAAMRRKGRERYMTRYTPERMGRASLDRFVNARPE
jgi:glycosyltransferase involved in cell wall biosynthesis